MGLIVPNGGLDAPAGQGRVVDMGELIAKIAADVAAKVMNDGFEPSFKELIEPYEKRIEELEATVKELSNNEC